MFDTPLRQIRWDHGVHVHIDHRIDVLNVDQTHSMGLLMLLTDMLLSFHLGV